MCLILCACECHPRCSLLVAANRDELYARPAAAAWWWEDSPAPLAGGDYRRNQGTIGERP